MIKVKHSLFRLIQEQRKFLARLLASLTNIRNVQLGKLSSTDLQIRLLLL